MIIGQPVLSVNRPTCVYFINNEKMIFGERLKQARLEAGLSQGDLAKLVGVKQATVAEAEAVGKSSKKILEYAKALKVNPDWLATGKGRMKPAALDFPDNSYLVEKGLSEVPVYGKGMGGLPDRLFTDEGRLENAHDEYGEVYSSDENAFITRVDGNSMFPKYHHGGYALVEPGTEPELEDDVLVKLTTGQVMLKKLVSRRGGIVLASYSDTVIYTFSPDQIVWIYYVAYPVPARKIKQRV